MPRRHNQGWIHVRSGPNRLLQNATGPVAPTVVSVGSRSGGGTSTPAAYAMPADIVSGDLLYLLVETANEDVVTSGDWTAITNQGTGTGGAADATRISIFFHVYAGVAPDTTVSCGGTSNHHMGAIVAFRGVGGGAAAGAVDTTADTSVEYPSVTTTVDNSLILLIEAHALPDLNSLGVEISGHTNANLTGITEVLDYNSAAGNGGGISVASGVMATAGATGTSTATLTTATKKGIITLALAPAT